MISAECEICARLGHIPVEGWIYEDEQFIVDIPVGAEVPGWLMVNLRRHAEPLTSALTVDEAAALGPLLKRLSAAVEQVTGAERVYHMQWGEYLPHWTMLLAPRGAEIPLHHRRIELLSNRAQYIDVAEAATVAGRIQIELEGVSR